MDNAASVSNAISSGRIHLLSHSLILASWLPTVFSIALRESPPVRLFNISLETSVVTRSREHETPLEALWEMLSDGIDVAVGDGVAHQEF
jgi:hypothetical protein